MALCASFVVHSHWDFQHLKLGDCVEINSSLSKHLRQIPLAVAIADVDNLHFVLLSCPALLRIVVGEVQDAGEVQLRMIFGPCQVGGVSAVLEWLFLMFLSHLGVSSGGHVALLGRSKQTNRLEVVEEFGAGADHIALLLVIVFRVELELGLTHVYLHLLLL